MSITLTKLAWAMRLSTAQKVVLVNLCDRASDDGGRCFPSIKTVAADAGLSERQTKRVVHWLIDGGYVHVVGNANGGAPGSSRHYQINVSKLRTGDTGDTGDKLARVTNWTETGDTGDTRRVTSATGTGDMGVTQTTIKQPPVNHKSNHQQTRATSDVKRKRLRPPETLMPDDFGISETVRAWAAKKGFDKLDDHLESFRNQAEAKGYRYSNWDAAFRNAVLGDWAKIRGPRTGRPGSNPPIAQDFSQKIYTGTPDDQLPEYLRA